MSGATSLVIARNVELGDADLRIVDLAGIGERDPGEGRIALLSPAPFVAMAIWVSSLVASLGMHLAAALILAQVP